MNIDDLDPSTPLMSQFGEETGPITLINTFIVPRELMDEVMVAYQRDAFYMKSQPGCISSQLHRGTAGSQVLVNVAVWESTEALVKAFSSPDFQAAASAYPEGVVAYPHIYRKVAVDGVCVA